MEAVISQFGGITPEQNLVKRPLFVTCNYYWKILSNIKPALVVAVIRNYHLCQKQSSAQGDNACGNESN